MTAMERQALRPKLAEFSLSTSQAVVGGNDGPGKQLALEDARDHNLSYCSRRPPSRTTDAVAHSSMTALRAEEAKNSALLAGS
jgi:hypothetical protein